jgi:hypothetical protein
MKKKERRTDQFCPLEFFVTAMATRPDFAAVQAIADSIKARVGGFTPTIGIICGSGLGGLAENIANPQYIEYKDIPGFPVSTGASYSLKDGTGSVYVTHVRSAPGSARPRWPLRVWAARRP